MQQKISGRKSVSVAVSIVLTLAEANAVLADESDKPAMNQILSEYCEDLRRKHSIDGGENESLLVSRVENHFTRSARIHQPTVEPKNHAAIQIA